MTQVAASASQAAARTATAWRRLERLQVIYISILCAVAFYGFHRYILVYLYVKHKKDGYEPKSRFNDLPRVTVQLPMFNEAEVAERVIKAACQIDYPLDKLEIHVLDDS